MKPNILKSQSYPRLQSAHIDLAAHLGACMAKERVGSNRLAMLNRIYINMTADAKMRVRAAMMVSPCAL